MVAIKITSDVREVERFLTATQRKKLPAIIVRALNRTAQQTQTGSAKAIHEEAGRDAGIARVAIKKAIRLTRANKRTLTAALDIFGKAIPLISFGARKQRGGVSAAPLGKRRSFGGAFIVKMGGHRGVFRRKKAAAASSGKAPSGQRKGRLPVRELWGPALPALFKRESVERIMRRIGVKRWAINFEREFRRLMKQ